MRRKVSPDILLDNYMQKPIASQRENTKHSTSIGMNSIENELNRGTSIASLVSMDQLISETRESLGRSSSNFAPRRTRKDDSAQKTSPVRAAQGMIDVQSMLENANRALSESSDRKHRENSGGQSKFLIGKIREMGFDYSKSP